MDPLSYCPECKRGATIFSTLQMIPGDNYHTGLYCDQGHTWTVETESPVLKSLGIFDNKGNRIDQTEKEEKDAESKEKG